MATNPLGDPDGLRRAARELERQADAIQGGAIASVDRAERMVWLAPPRSDAIRALYVDGRRRADDLAGQLRDLADGLRRDAVEVEDRVAGLRGLERKARQAIEGLVAARSPLPFPTPYDPGRLPPPAHPDWEKVARLLRIR